MRPPRTPDGLGRGVPLDEQDRDIIGRTLLAEHVLEEIGDVVARLTIVHQQLSVPAESFETDIEGLTSTFDEAVGVQQDRGSEPQRNDRFGERRGLRQAERQVRPLLGRERGALPIDDERRSVTGGDEPEGPEVSSQDAHEQRDEFALTEVPVELIRSSDDLRGSAPDEGEGTEGVPHLPHQRRRSQTMPRDIPDHEDELTGRQRERVVPVTPDADGRGGRQVPRRDPKSRHEGEHVRQERPLERIEDDAAAVRQANLQGECHAIGDELHQFDLIVRERMRCRRAHVHDPDHLAVRQQRDAQERTDPLLEEDRIQDGAVVHSIERDRPSFGSDTSGEPLPDRDTDPLLDFFLYPFRCSGDELIRRWVEQQDGCRVGIQDVPHAQEQLVEQIVHTQMGEGRISDELHAPESLHGVEDLGSTLKHGSILGDGKLRGQTVA